jgi:hypothetical protein
MEELSIMVDALRAETPHTGKLVKVRRIGQGDWLYANHEAFKPKTIEE